MTVMMSDATLLSVSDVRLQFGLSLQILSSPIFWFVLVVHLLSDGFHGLRDLD
jgi:hypothetical protein